MKAFIFLLFVSLTVCTHATDLEYLRKNYSKAVNDKELCRTIINKLSEDANTQVEKAYLGAFYTIWANHVSSPFAKLATFSKGKTAIEQAVQKESDNVEIRFLRLSVQTNCPSFLGYNSNIESDRKFLKGHLGSITSAELKKMVKALIE